MKPRAPSSTLTGHKMPSTCTRQTTKKYVTRASPPIPANACPAGQRRRGNDGSMYVATPNKHGVNRWVGVTGATRRKTAAAKATPASAKKSTGGRKKKPAAAAKKASTGRRRKKPAAAARRAWPGATRKTSGAQRKALSGGRKRAAYLTHAQVRRMRATTRIVNVDQGGVATVGEFLYKGWKAGDDNVVDESEGGLYRTGYFYSRDVEAGKGIGKALVVSGSGSDRWRKAGSRSRKALGAASGRPDATKKKNKAASTGGRKKKKPAAGYKPYTHEQAARAHRRIMLAHHRGGHPHPTTLGRLEAYEVYYASFRK